MYINMYLDVHTYMYISIYTPYVCVFIHIYVERDTIVDGNQGNSNDQETLLLLIFHIHIGKIECGQVELQIDM